jgi:hypothetical protein
VAAAKSSRAQATGDSIVTGSDERFNGACDEIFENEEKKRKKNWKRCQNLQDNTTHANAVL